jgi:WD40 repeat protein
VNVRVRLVALAAVVVLSVAGTVIYVASVRGERAREAAAAPVVAVADLSVVTQEPHVVFRSTAIGDDYGRVAVVSLAAPAGPRAYTPATCDRVYARRAEAVCLFAKPGLVTTYRAEVLGADWAVRRTLPLSGVPSRTRLSPDSSWAATTTFVSGHDYTSPGQFSTETRVTRLAGGPSLNLEDFRLEVDGRRITNKNRNMWGVTFVDDDRFYATAASGNKTWLVRGSIPARELVALREDAECPSLSPDGTRLAFKTRDGEPAGQWRIAVYDIASGRATILAEQHSVDDQIEWLDDKQVLYGLPRSGNGPSASDVWTVPADGSGSPRLFIPDAWSPAVIR